MEHQSPVSIKSALLLADLKASGTTSVIEPASSRDHTERMLKAFGAEINIRGELGRNVVIKPGKTLTGQKILIPEILVQQHSGSLLHQ